jgi:hypothetical protein
MPRTPEQLKACCTGWPESIVVSAVEETLGPRKDLDVDDEEWRGLIRMVANWLTHSAPADATPSWLTPPDIVAIWRALRAQRR